MLALLDQMRRWRLNLFRPGRAVAALACAGANLIGTRQACDVGREGCAGLRRLSFEACCVLRDEPLSPKRHDIVPRLAQRQSESPSSSSRMTFSLRPLCAFAWPKEDHNAAP